MTMMSCRQGTSSRTRTQTRTFISYFCGLLLIFLANDNINAVEAHGFLKSPRSRSYYASVEGVTWGEVTGKPAREYCPHCINLKEETQVCGTGSTQNYDTWLDSAGNPMPWISQGIYTEGQEIIIEAELSANHAGHFDLFVCPDGSDSTQQCFLDNPMTLVEDLLNGGPVDEDYPSRAYAAPVINHRFKYRLPMGVHGSQVMMQWRYVTANSCFPPGYKREELGLRELGWLRAEGMVTCDWPLNWTGDRDPTNPEQFWNCAEITINPANPTKSPRPTPVPVPPVPAPVQSPVQSPVTPPTSNTGGCCTWDNGASCGTGWCNESKSNCEGSCAGTYIGGSPIAPTVPSPVAAPVPTIPSGFKTATTTRYWDCSGGACGCAYLPFGPGTNDQPAHCYSNAMFEAPKSNSYGAKYYGTAAISKALGGGDWMAEGCGKCWKVRGWSNVPNKDTFQTTLVLKGTNYCPPSNTACSGNKAHFDIAAPGFDVTEYSLSNTCAVREEAEIEGFKSCGRWLIDDPNSDIGCDCSKFKDPVLRAGCDNFFSLLWDNSQVDYEEVECPVELSRLNCWEENGGGYPNGVPEFCASNLGEIVPSPTPTPPTCKDISGKFKVGKKNRNCKWASNKAEKRCIKTLVAKKCPITCDTCNCEDTKRKVKVEGETNKKKCNWVRKNNDVCSQSKVAKNCPVACRTCDQSNPVESPVESPVTNPTVSGDYCCSDDLKNCKVDAWCNANEEQCNGCSARWILKNPDCDLAWWDDCMSNPDGCCPPAKCEDFGTWAQCRV